MLRPLCRDLFPLMDIHNLGDLFFSFNKFIYIIYIYILKNRVESRRFSSVETKEEIKEIPRMFRVLRGRGVLRLEKICVVCATCYLSCGKNSLHNRRHLFLTGTEEILYIYKSIHDMRCAIFGDLPLYMANFQEKESAKNPANVEVLDLAAGSLLCDATCLGGAMLKYMYIYIIIYLFRFISFGGRYFKQFVIEEKCIKRCWLQIA